MKFSTKTNYAVGNMCMGKAAQIAFLKSGRILRTKQAADSPPTACLQFPNKKDKQKQPCIICLASSGILMG